MWPFHRREKPIRKAWENLIVGLVIGGAIGSIIGKHMMEKNGGKTKSEEENGGDDDEGAPILS